MTTLEDSLPDQGDPDVCEPVACDLCGWVIRDGNVGRAYRGNVRYDLCHFGGAFTDDCYTLVTMYGVKPRTERERLNGL